MNLVGEIEIASNYSICEVLVMNNLATLLFHMNSR